MRALKVLALCLGAAFVCAFVYVATLRYSLPRTDTAYGASLSQVFSDPFVSVVAAFGAILFGLVAFPFAYFTVRNRRLAPAALFIFGMVLAEILLVTPFWGWFGLFGALPSFAVALLVCRFSHWRIFTPHTVDSNSV
jgi:hypothetical protein